MKFQFAQSSRVIEATSVKEFTVIQDNRKKTVHILHYETSRGPSEITFLNGIEAMLNGNGRYVRVKSKAEDCAKLIKDEPTKEQAPA